MTERELHPGVIALAEALGRMLAIQDEEAEQKAATEKERLMTEREAMRTLFGNKAERGDGAFAIAWALLDLADAQEALAKAVQEWAPPLTEALREISSRYRERD